MLVIHGMSVNQKLFPGPQSLVGILHGLWTISWINARREKLPQILDTSINVFSANFDNNRLRSENGKYKLDIIAFA